MILTEEEIDLLKGTIKAISIDMEYGEYPTYFDDGDPSNYKSDGKDWECEEWGKRNGNKVIKLINRILEESK